MKKKIVIIIISLILVISISSFFYYTFYLDMVSQIDILLNGDENINIKVFSNYQDMGAIASFRNKDISYLIETENDLNLNKIGDYKYTYTIKYKNKENMVQRKIKVYDDELPTIELNGQDNVTLYLNEKYIEEGVAIKDNYDEDLTYEVEGKVDTSKEGEYTLLYKVKDSSNNEAQVKRIVKVIPRPLTHKGGVAVLNYHFFSSGNCTIGNCVSAKEFESHLKYLKENNYKVLTMDEFIKYMYNEMDIPEKSVLITIDDGGAGTGTNNGNVLIPLLEKYQTPATLFLISGWWGVNNYQSKYLEIQSHTHDMHTENYCQGVSRGAKMLCLSNEEVKQDLITSINTIGSNKAFCYPFYVYSNQTIEILKELGFKVAFAGGNYKATRNSNKYAIPRFQIKTNITMDQFISYIY